MPVTYNDRYTTNEVHKIQTFSAVVGYEGETTRLSTLARYTTEPLERMKDILNALQPHMDGKVKNLVAVTHDTNEAIEPKPESVPRGATMKFSIKLAGAPAGLPGQIVSQYVPYFVAASAEDIQALGELIASILVADPNITEADYIEWRPAKN